MTHEVVYKISELYKSHSHDYFFIYFLIESLIRITEIKKETFSNKQTSIEIFKNKQYKYKQFGLTEYIQYPVFKADRKDIIFLGEFDTSFEAKCAVQNYLDIDIYQEDFDDSPIFIYNKNKDSELFFWNDYVFYTRNIKNKILIYVEQEKKYNLKANKNYINYLEKIHQRLEKHNSKK